MPAPRRRMARWSTRAGLVLAGLLASILGLELAFGALDVGYPAFYVWDPVLGLTLNPGYEGRYRGDGDTRVRISHAGLRDRDHPLAKPPGTYRIAVLGDSNAEAFQVQVEQAFWSVLERGLAGCSAPRTVEIINFGVGGYSTGQELLMLRERVLAYSPDAVVLAFFAGNDVADNSRLLSGEDRPYFELRDGALAVDDSFRHRLGLRLSPLGRAYYWLEERSRVLQVVEHTRQVAIALRSPTAGAGVGMVPGVYAPFAVSPELYREPTDPRWQDAWRATEALLLEMKRETADHRVRFIVTTVSTEVQVYPDRSFREGLARELSVTDLDYADRRVTWLGATNGFPVFPLAGPLREYADRTGAFLHGSPPRPRGVGHWNVEGHRVAGEFLVARACSELFPSKPSS